MVERGHWVSLGRVAGQGEEHVVEIRCVDGQVFGGDIVAEAGEHVAQRGDAALARDPQRQFLLLACAFGQRSGRRLERGGVGEAQPDMRAGDPPFELGRGAVGDDAAPVEHGDPAGELVGLLQVLRGQEDRDALGDQIADELPHDVAAARVQAGGGLVEEDQPRPSHQGHRDIEAALHAAGVGSRGLPRRLGEVEPIQQSGGAGPPLSRRPMQQTAHQEQVLLTGEQVVDRGELPGDPDHRAHRVGRAAHVVAHHAGHPTVRRNQRGQDLARPWSCRRRSVRAGRRPRPGRWTGRRRPGRPWSPYDLRRPVAETARRVACLVSAFMPPCSNPAPGSRSRPRPLVSGSSP